MDAQANSDWIDAVFGGVIAALVVFKRRATVLFALLRIARGFAKATPSKEEKVMGENKLGIKSLMNVVSLLAILGNIGGKAYEDGKIDGKDFVLATDLIAAFPLLLSTDFLAIIPEAKDLTEAEQAELTAFFKDRFDIPQDSVEHTIETVLDLVRRQVSLIADAIAMFRKPVAA